MKAPTGRSLGTDAGISKQAIARSIMLVIGLVTMAGSFIYTTLQGRDSGEHLALVSEQQLLSQQISVNAVEASHGMVAPGARLNGFISRFDEILQTFRSGLQAVSADLSEPLSSLENEWQRTRQSLVVISNGLKTIQDVSDLSEKVQLSIPDLIEESERAVAELIRSGASGESIYIASRQLVLIERMGGHLFAIVTRSPHPTSASRFLEKNGSWVVVTSGFDATSSSTQLGKDLTQFGNVMNGLLGRGSNPLGITRVSEAKALAALKRVRTNFNGISEDISAVLSLAPEMSKINVSADAVAERNASLLGALTAFRAAIVAGSGQRQLVFLIGVFGAALVVLSLIMLAYFLWHDAETRIEASTEQNKRNQRAIVRLLNEMGSLADGDLSAYATVTEEFTGSIADSFNYAIDTLRNLVVTINRTSAQVLGAAGQTQSTAARLADASSLQSRAIASSSVSINEMAEIMTRISKNAQDSQNVALNSVAIANKGAETVSRNIDAMDGIREQIQETSKRIKRLGESSQEIGDIIGLINEIADRTNILALNAAIQASTAGEAGRGFAVVADEVQRLAERAGDATRQVEVLVKAIQADTSEAVASMERSTSGVVSGAKLAENAGSALVEVESVSQQLAGLIQNISKEANQQAEVANTLSSKMGVIRDITVQTSDSTTETASSIGKLTVLAGELSESVAGFKLPEEEQKMMESTITQANPDDA